MPRQMTVYPVILQWAGVSYSFIPEIISSSLLESGEPPACCLASPMYLPISALWESVPAKNHPAEPIYTYANHPTTAVTTIHDQLFNQFEQHRTNDWTNLTSTYAIILEITQNRIGAFFHSAFGHILKGAYSGTQQ